MENKHSAGPGLRVWNRVSEYEVGRPKLRAKKNPVPAASGTASTFPFNMIDPVTNVTLQLLAWNLRDTDIILANKGFNVIRQLFTTGQNGALAPFGSTTPFNKPIMLSNVQSNNGLLPSPQSFLVTHLRQIVRSDIQLADLINLCYSTYYQFVAGDQNWVYFEGPGAVLPSGATTPFPTVAGTTYNTNNSNAGVGWPTTHNVASVKSGLYDPTIQAEDQGYNIAQNKQFRFMLDPTQFSFISNTVVQGYWNTVNNNGTGIQISIELCGVLARGMNG
jgi:hypothetical protein